MKSTIKPILRYDREISEVARPVKERPSPDGDVVWHSKASCERKTSGFKLEREAWFHLRGMRRSGRDCTGRVVYQCRWCGLWHIGKRVGVKNAKG